MRQSLIDHPPVDRLQQAVKIIETAQKDGMYHENPDHLFLLAIRDFFEADGCILIRNGSEDFNLASKKVLGQGPDWKITIDLQFDKGILWNCFQEKRVLEVSDPTEWPEYAPEIDAIKETKSQFMVCSPIQSHGKKFGVLALINPKNYFIETQDKTLFLVFSTALADQIHFSLLLSEARAVDSDLQVSRLQLLKSRNILRTVFDHIPESFYLVDTEYKLEAINLSRANRVGKPPRELVGKTCYEVLFGLSAPCAECIVPHTLETGTSSYVNGLRRGGEKSPREWDISSYPVMDKNGKIQEVILLEQDITERHKLEAELIQSEKLIAVGQLAAGVAHEINNPLTSILANAQLILLDLDPSQTDLIESVKLIEMAGIRATNVVKNLQGLVRKEDYEFLPVDLNESIQSSLMLVSHEFISRQISIRFTRGEDMPMILASANHLQGIWINLLMNAIEAIGDKKGEIKIDTLYDGENFYVEIKDTGAGINEENLDRIFEPFFSTKKTGQGTGLGLSLVKRIIQAHAGQILVESSPGNGARFTIVLPERSEKDIRFSPKVDLGLI